MSKLSYIAFICSLFLSSFLSFSQVQTDSIAVPDDGTRIYLNADWEVCKAENALYYRDFGKEVSDSLWEVFDYYLDGRLQFKGYTSIRSEPLFLTGRTIWYDEKGDTSGFADFVNNERKGWRVNFYPNGQRKNVFNIVNTDNDGIFRTFYPWGALKNMWTYSNGWYGQTTEYTIRGLVRSIKRYNDNHDILLEHTYYDNGNPRRSVEMASASKGVIEEWFENNQLRTRYEILDGKVNGYYTEFNEKGDTVVKAFFNGYKPEYYHHKYIGLGSHFEKHMVRKQGIEYWKVYRDSALVLEGQYNDDYRSAYQTTWTLYTINGKDTLMTFTFEDPTFNFEIVSNYKSTFELRELKSLFMPFLGLRISNTSYWGCETIYHISQDPLVNNELHPFTKRLDNVEPTLDKLLSGVIFFEQSGAKTAGTLHSIYEDSIDYTDPSERDSFITKNKATVINMYHEHVTHFKRTFGNLVVYFYAAHDIEVLKRIKSEAVLQENEVYFFYGQFESMVYPKGAMTMNRWMDWKVTTSIAMALNEKVIKSYDLFGLIENKIFFTSDFSGFTADSALEKHLLKHNARQ
jgi:antitoxin component YwqK of YwqJK toxin-antitoxin module